MTSSVHLDYLLEKRPHFQGPFITSWLFSESLRELVLFTDSGAQREGGMETPCGGRARETGRVALEQGAGHSSGQLKCGANAGYRGTEGAVLAKARCEGRR